MTAKHSVEEFAALPWGGTAHKNVDGGTFRAVRIPERPGDTCPWQIDPTYDGSDDWRTDTEMAQGGWGLGEPRAAQTSTLREVLEAEWKKATVPDDGLIPACAPFIARDPGGDFTIRWDGLSHFLPASDAGIERRLLTRPVDPEVQALADVLTAEGIEDALAVARRLHAAGVRAGAES